MGRLGALAGLLLAACASLPTLQQRRDAADALAAEQGWRAQTLAAGEFDLVAYLPASPVAGERLTIYIEGDGLAWIGTSRPSSDPTPRDPLALRLALAQPAGNAAYLARPCQYVDAQAVNCAPRYWTASRYAAEVIAASNRAVDALKARFSARHLTLVGYSGGGAVTALVAARRDDVNRLLTVAGNLDHAAWTRGQRIDPLTASLNPADESDALRRVRQVHFVGTEDRTIPPALVQGYVGRYPAAQRPQVRIETGFDHACCWAQAWPRLWREAAD